MYDSMDGGGRIALGAAIENNAGAVIEGRGSRAGWRLESLDSAIPISCPMDLGKIKT